MLNDDLSAIISEHSMPVQLPDGSIEMCVSFPDMASACEKILNRLPLYDPRRTAVEMYLKASKHPEWVTDIKPTPGRP